MWKKQSSVIKIILALSILLTFAFPYVVHAEGPYKYHRYPGPWEYEKDIVTVACAQLYAICDSSAQLENMKTFVLRAAEKGVNILLFPETPCWVIPNKAEAELSTGPTSLEIERLAKQYNISLSILLSILLDNVIPFSI